MKVIFPKQMSEATAIRLSILHWQRMIRWAEKQEPGMRVDNAAMEIMIGESLVSENCALCYKHKITCYRCPLSQSGNECDDTVEESIYDRVKHSSTWGEWVINAKAMLRVLKSLEVKK